MEIEDSWGVTNVDREEDLERRLRLVRSGRYGAFFLKCKSSEAELWVHINNDVAYLHFFPRSGCAGFQPTGMSPGGCDATVHFLMIGGDEGSAFDVPREALVSVETAYAAANEFFRVPLPPPSISWVEL